MGLNFLILLLFLLLTFRATLPLIFHLRTHVAGVDLGDPLHILSVIGWNYHSLTHGFKNYWNPPYFYPHEFTLAYSEHFFVPSLLAVPIIYVTGDLILAYNVLFMFSFTLCAFGNFLLIRYLTGSRLAGILGGIELAYSTYMLSNFAQLPYIVAQWIPFAFLYLLKFFEDRTYKSWLLFILFYLLQVLSSAYYGLFLTIFAGVFVLAFGVKQNLFRTPKFWKQLLLSLILLLPISGFFFYPYLEVKSQMGFQRNLGEIHYFSANIRDYARVMPTNYLYGKTLYPPGIGTTSPFWLFPGITALFLGLLGLSNLRVPWKNLILKSLGLLLLIGFFLFFALGYEFMVFPLLLLGTVWLLYPLYRARKQRSGARGQRPRVRDQEVVNKSEQQTMTPSIPFRARPEPAEGTGNNQQKTDFYQKMFLIGFILAFLFSFGPIMSFHEKEVPYGPYSLLYYLVPGFKGIRVVSRFNVMVTFFLGVLAGFGLAKLLNRISKKYIQGVIGVLLAAVLFLEHCTAVIWIVPANVHNPTLEVYTWLREQPGDFTILELPWKPVDIMTAYYAMTVHGKKTVGGYSSFIPPFTHWFFQQMETFPSEHSIKMIQAMGIRYLIVHNRRFIQERGRSDVYPKLMELARSFRTFKYFPSSDIYVFEVLDTRGELFNLETTRDPVKLIVPDPIPRHGEVSAFLDVILPSGALRLSPYPKFNSQITARWIKVSTLSTAYPQDPFIFSPPLRTISGNNVPQSINHSQDVRLPEKFLLSDRDHQLPFMLKAPAASGIFQLEIYDGKGKRLIDRKIVTVN